MKQGTIGKSELGGLLDAAAEIARIYAPQQREGKAGDVALAPYEHGRAIALDYANATLSPKSLFFPQCETLCAFKNERLVDVPSENENFIVFGIRPCDARAIWCLDKLFGEFGKTRDPYYMQRREHSLVIALACLSPADTCFCTSVGGDPFAASGADILAVDLGDQLLFDAETPNGEAFMKEFERFFKPASAAQISACADAAKDARDKVPKQDLDGLVKKLRAGFDSDAWASISEICRGCGLCTYLCPTCHCFDITDERKWTSGRRIRTWDSCQYPLFTLHASGHNPRPSAKERMRQRILHKFLYTVDNVDAVFCVGCGRCVINCPVNLDLREVLKRLASGG